MDFKMRLAEVKGISIFEEPEYELIVEFPADAEISLEFFQKAKDSKAWKSIEDYLAKNAKGLKVKTIKILAAGIIIAAIPFIGAKAVEAAKNEKFSMTYVYGGSVADQIEHVRSAKDALDTVSPSYFDILSDGSLQVNAISSAFVNSMHDMGIKVVPFLSNHWNRTGGQLALKDPEGLATKLANQIQLYNLDGINVDIENVTDKERDAYTALVTALRKKIPAHKEVSVAVAANPNNWQTGWHGSYDYTKLAANSDYLMLMTYDEHYDGGDPGPVASIQFIEKSIQYALSQTSKDKVVVGLPFFGRIWSDDGTVKGKGLTLTQIENMVRDYKGTVTYDTSSQSPKAVFTVKSGDKAYTVGGKTLAPGKYTVWYENEQSLAAKSALMYKYDILGVGSWALGQATDRIKGDIISWVGGSSNTVTQNTATQTGYVTASSLNVRKSASASVAVLTSIPKGQAVTLVGNAVNGWYQVKLSNGTMGYVSAQYISLSKPSTTTNTTTQTASTKTGYVTASTLNVRKSASTSAAKLTTVSKGQAVTIVGNAVNGWYQVKLSNGTTGYVSAQYISLSKPSTTTNTTTQTASTQTGYVTASTLNVRKSASTSAAKLTTVSKGQAVTIVGNAVNGWYQIKLSNGTTGYVSSQYISLAKTSTSTSTAANKTGKVTASTLNVRQSASTSAKVISTLKNGQSVTIIGNAVNGWYQVKLSNGTTGYVSAQYIKV